MASILTSTKEELGKVIDEARELEKRFVEELSAVLQKHHRERIDRFIEANAIALASISDGRIKELKSEMEGIVAGASDTVTKNFADLWWQPDNQEICSLYEAFAACKKGVIPEGLKIGFAEFGRSISLIAQHHGLPIDGKESDNTLKWEGDFAGTFYAYCQIVKKGIALAEQIKKLRQDKTIESARKRWDET